MTSTAEQQGGKHQAGNNMTSTAEQQGGKHQAGNNMTSTAEQQGGKRQAGDAATEAPAPAAAPARNRADSLLPDAMEATDDGSQSHEGMGQARSKL
jgi:hypothetical protein